MQRLTLSLCADCGTQAHQDLTQKLSEADMPDGVRIQKTTCLGPCYKPMVLALQAPKSAVYVFAGITVDAAADIAATLLTLAEHMQDGAEGGTYHYAGAPHTSWAEFAREIFKQAGRDVAVTGIPSADYPTPAQRPLNSRLDCAKLASDFGITAPDWKAGLAAVLKDLKI